MSFTAPAGWDEYGRNGDTLTVNRANHTANWNDLVVLNRKSDRKVTPSTSKYLLKYLISPSLSNEEDVQTSSPDMIMDWSFRNVISNNDTYLASNRAVAVTAMEELGLLLADTTFQAAVLDDLGYPDI
jgi:hypothetical protein